MYWKSTGFNSLARPAQLWVARLAEASVDTLAVQALACCGLAAIPTPYRALPAQTGMEAGRRAGHGVRAVVAPCARAPERPRATTPLRAAGATRCTLAVARLVTCDPRVCRVVARPALAQDGSGLASHPTNLINQTAPWEARNGVGCIEAPALLQHGGRTRLFYSGGDWTAGLNGVPYSIGYADCTTPFGPCRKTTTAAPWFGPGYNNTVGPGGQEFFLVDGEPWIGAVPPPPPLPLKCAPSKGGVAHSPHAARPAWAPHSSAMCAAHAALSVVFHGWRRGKAGYGNGGERTVRFYPLASMPSLNAGHAQGGAREATAAA